MEGEGDMTTERRSRIVESFQRRISFELHQQGETMSSVGQRIGKHKSAVSRALRPGASPASLATLCELAESLNLGVSVVRECDED